MLSKRNEYMKLVYIEWIDSHSGRGWTSVEDISDHCRPLRIITVGWLISENNNCKAVAHSVYDEKRMDGWRIHASGEIVIPNLAIKKFRVLKTPPK